MCLACTSTSYQHSHDGNALAIGSPCSQNSHVVLPGYVRVFSLVEGDDIAGTGCWEQIGGDILGEANSHWFGISVSLSDDAKTLAVGGRRYHVNNESVLGHMRVY